MKMRFSQIFLIMVNCCFVYTQQGIQIIEQSITNFCPQQYFTWKIDEETYNKACRNGTKYHCLETQANTYIKLCASPIYISEGFYPLYSEAGGKLYSDRCSRDMYQPVAMMSNEFYSAKCEKQKDLCDNLGEFQCDDGSSVEDRECGCNYTAGYRVQQFYMNNPQNLTCFKRKVMLADCKYLPCKDAEKELDPAYYCVPKCPSGYHRPWRQFKCIQSRHSTDSATQSMIYKTTKPAFTSPITTQSPAVSGKPKKGSPPKVHMGSNGQNYTIAIIITVIVFFSIFVGMVICIIRKQGGSQPCNCVCTFVLCKEGWCRHGGQETNIQGHNVMSGSNNVMSVDYRDSQPTTSQGNEVNQDEACGKHQDQNKGDQQTPTPINGYDRQPVACYEDLVQEKIKESLDRLGTRILPEFQIVHNPLQSLPKNHGLYFSLHFLLQMYYKEKICSVRNVFEFHRKISLYFAQKFSSRYANANLDGYAQRNSEDKTFGGEFTLKEISALYDVPVVVLLLKEKSLERHLFNLNSEGGESSQVKPVLYIGCLQIDAGQEEYFFVPLQGKDTEIDGGITKSITEIEESLNKSEDDNGYYMVHHNLLGADVHESIGFIKCGDKSGTGYRVGSVYLITALHVVIKAYGHMWHCIFQSLQGDVQEISVQDTMRKVYGVTINEIEINKNDMDLIECFQKRLPVCLNISALLIYLQDNGFENKADKVKEIVDSCKNKTELIFGWTHASAGNEAFKLSLDITYANYDQDIAILRIVPDDQRNEFPKRFILCREKTQTFDGVHILGHPNGKPLQFDPNCKMVLSDQEIQRIKDKARNYFTSNIKPPLQEDYKEKVCTEYRDLSIKPGFALMHCSFTFDKGASGGPCLIYDKTLNAPIVVGTVQKGFPWSFFSLFNESQKRDSRNQFEIFLERGLLSSRLWKLLEESDLSELKNDIFNETRDQNTVLAAKIQAPGGPVEFITVRKESVTIKWTKAQTDGDVTVKKYHIEKAEPPDHHLGVPTWEKCGEENVTNTEIERYECEVRDLTPNKKYIFKVYAEGRDGQLGLFLQSDEIIAQDRNAPLVPEGPLIIKAKENGVVQLSWKQNASSTDSQDLEYNVQVSKDNGSWVNKATVTDCTQANLYQMDLNGSYLFQVYAQNANGKSPPLRYTGNPQIKHLFLPPAVSSKPEAVVQGLRVELKWPAICDVIYPVTEYQIHYDTGHLYFTCNCEGRNEGDIIYKTTDLDVGKEYTFSVCAKNHIGCGPKVKSDRVVIKGTPERPTGPLRCLFTDGAHMKLQWLPSPGEGGSPVLAYFVEKHEDGRWSQIDKTDSNVHCIVYQNIERGRSYRFRVYAENENGQSDYLETSEDIKIPYALPQAPSRTVEPVSSNGSATLHWGPPEDDGGSPITKYIVYQKQEGSVHHNTTKDEESGLLDNWEHVCDCDSSLESHTIPNLTVNETYKFKITAVNGVGKGEALEFQSVQIVGSESFLSRVLSWRLW